ncbi:MAG: lipid-binding SYLF domain-containing protein [Pseudohongiellaceae bacterium]|jgi:lipid-binding SYLF domain-containing protein
MTKSIRFTLVAICLLILGSCTTTGMGSGTPQERRSAILEMRQEVLNELRSIKPDTQAQIGNAVGYAVFSNANINLIFASFGGGYGIVHDNQSGADTYMRMGEVGIGIGAGIKDFRAVFVFHNEAALQRFMDIGLSVGGQADAAAKAGDLGAAVGGEALIDNVSVYQLTQSGLALQATIKGTRYWHDSDLN